MTAPADTETRLDSVMGEIESLGVGTAEYHEAMWFLLTIMARRQAVIAESIRANTRRRARAAETRAARKAGA